MSKVDFQSLNTILKAGWEEAETQREALEERVTSLELQVQLLASILTQKPHGQVRTIAEQEADLFAPRGKEWDKSAGLEVDELDCPYPVHCSDCNAILSGVPMMDRGKGELACTTESCPKYLVIVPFNYVADSHD
jgi:hypothetical protein